MTPPSVLRIVVAEDDLLGLRVVLLLDRCGLADREPLLERRRCEPCPLRLLEGGLLLLELRDRRRLEEAPGEWERCDDLLGCSLLELGGG